MRKAPFRFAIAVILGLTLTGLAACGGGSSKSASPTSSSVAPSSPSSSTSIANPTSTTIAATQGRGLSGIVTVVAGNGSDDGKGVPGPASDASLGSATHFALAKNGDIFVTNGSLNVLKISGGQVSVFGHLDPQGGPGTGGVAVAPNGSVYVVTPSTVRKFSSDGKTSTVVLNARAAGLSTSLGPIAINPAGTVYIGDGSPRITRILIDGTKSAFAGTTSQAPANSAPGDGGKAVAAALGTLSQFAIDASGNVLIADVHAHRVRKVARDGTITTIAGGGTTKLLASTQQSQPTALRPPTSSSRRSPA